MKNIFFTALMLFSVSMLTISCENYDDTIQKPSIPIKEIPTPGEVVDLPPADTDIKDGFAGFFTVNEVKYDTRFVKLMLLNNSKKDKNNNDSENSRSLAIFESIDAKGNAIEVYKFMAVFKNTGKDVAEGKLKEVEEGFKLFIEIPVVDGKMDLNNAVVGNLGYTISGKDNVVKIQVSDLSEIKFDLKELDIPEVITSGNKGKKLYYNLGKLNFDINVKLNSGEIIGKVDSVISVIYPKGKKSADKLAVNTEIIKKNVK